MKKLLMLFLVLGAMLWAGVAPFGKGERVVFFGDSITHGGGYIFHIQMFEDLRYPGSGTTMMNAGISGDSAGGGCRRWDYEVLPMAPDRVFVMFGMNDVGRSFYNSLEPTEEEQKRRQGRLTSYADNQKKLAEMILASGKKLVLVTPTPFDQYGEVKAANSVACNEPGLASCATIVRELAAEKGLDTVELHKPYTELLKAHTDLHLCGQDRVHPREVGHLLMAALILDATGEKGVVASVTMNVAGGKAAVETANAEATDVSVGANGVSFKYSPKALPFPCLDEYKTLDTIYPITEKLNRELLCIKGLAGGNYLLKADGVEIGKATAEELAKGVNIAILDTPSQKKAQAAGKVMRKLKTVASTVRNIPYMNTVILNQKGNLDNMEECFQVLDKWVETKVGSPQENYFRNVVKTYKKVRPVIAEKHQEMEALRKELAAFAPEPFTIAVEAIKE